MFETYTPKSVLSAHSPRSRLPCAHVARGQATMTHEGSLLTEITIGRCPSQESRLLEDIQWLWKSDFVCQILQFSKRNSKARFLCKIWFLNVGNELKIFIKHPMCQIHPVAARLNPFSSLLSFIFTSSQLTGRQHPKLDIFAWLLKNIFIQLRFNMMASTYIKTQCLFCYVTFLIKIHKANFYWKSLGKRSLSFQIYLCAAFH